LNILTFDIEEWYTYVLFKKGSPKYFEPILKKLLDHVLAGLEKKQIHATFFCLGKIARDYPEIIQQIHKSGHTIGCHSDQHKFVNKLSRKEFYEDTKIALQSLEDVIGVKVESYRAPAFTITDSNIWALEVLIELGVKFDSSIFPSSRSYGGFKAFSSNIPTIISTKSGDIYEFPVNSKSIFFKKIMFSGGGYFRLLPYQIIKFFMQESQYSMCYFHLRDFDKDQIKIYNHRYFMHYVGINSALSKFDNLINEFKFMSLGQASNLIDWDKSKKIYL
jgi:polysaccharide deacetylase family protein (PEP-CTERM system associated)